VLGCVVFCLSRMVLRPCINPSTLCWGLCMVSSSAVSAWCCARDGSVISCPGSRPWERQPMSHRHYGREPPPGSGWHR